MAPQSTLRRSGKASGTCTNNLREHPCECSNDVQHYDRRLTHNLRDNIHRRTKMPEDVNTNGRKRACTAIFMFPAHTCV
jgi:hypothetical protein